MLCPSRNRMLPWIFDSGLSGVLSSHAYYLQYATLFLSAGKDGIQAGMLDNGCSSLSIKALGPHRFGLALIVPKLLRPI
jgi:hypothetical protein